MDTGIIIGGIARDRANGRIGKVMGATHGGTLYYLRPVNGGREWDTAPANVEMLDGTEDATPAAEQ